MLKSKKCEVFSKRLADELSYQGYSNKSFAEKIGISINTLNIYLYRDSMPSADVALKMAEALNITVEDLFKEKSSNDVNNWQKNEIHNITNSFTPKQLSSFLKIARIFKESVQEKD